MNKAEIVSILEESREQFLDLIEGLSEDEMLAPDFEEGWSLRDILVHLTRWEAEAVKLLWQLKQGQKPTTIHFSGLSTDEINARWQAESRGRELERALEDYHGVRTQTLRRLEDFTERELVDPQRYRALKGQSVWDWIAEDTSSHEAEHAEQIRARRASENGGGSG